MEASNNGKRAKAGRPFGTKRGVNPSKTVRIPKAVAEMIRERFQDTTNPKMVEWLKKLP